MTKVLLPEAAFRRAMVAVGTPGAGKSYNVCGAVVIPMLEAGRHVVIIDPTDAWFGLTLKPDGKTASGYDIAIFGGDHGNMPLTPNMGRALGELLGKERINAILSLNNMELSEQVHFVSEFANAIMRHNRKPIHLIIDEADEFCPQQTFGSGELSVCKGRVKRIVTRGRKPGFRPVMITQRPQALDTSVRNACQVLMALQCTGHHERSQLEDYVKANGDPKAMAEMLGSLSQLGVGEAWIWAPRDKVLDRVKFPRIPVYDSFAEEDDDPHAFKGTVPIDKANLSAIHEALAEFEASRKANDPDALRDRIIELERELQIASATAGADALAEHHAASEDELELARQEGTNAEREAAAVYVNRLRDDMAATLISLQVSVESIRTAASEVLATWPLPPTIPAPSFTKPPVPAIRRAPVSEIRPPMKLTSAGDLAPIGNVVTEGLTGGQQRTIDAVAWWNAVGIAKPTKTQVCGLLKTKPGGSTARGLFAATNKVGLTEASEGSIWLTTDGRHAAKAPTNPSRAELHKRVLSIFPQAVQDILVMLLQAGGDALDKAAIATALGVEPGGSTARGYFAKLSKSGVTKKAAEGSIAAADWLFTVKR